ncbi:MAG: T9SS type A sorting domain-containing protein [Bacteroidetes bacterium]|nr:T9SS type A sorting domain-containing protein [Bacteroidota bacterium]
MKSLIRIAGILLMILNSFTSHSAIVPFDRARIAAGNFYSEKTSAFTGKIEFGEFFIIEEEQLPLCYIYNINKGFVIIAAHDNVFPVIAWSSESAYTNSDLPPALSRWMESYHSHIFRAFKENTDIPQFISRAWKIYGDENFKPNKSLAGVDPILLTTWSQGCFYNSQFPADTNCPCDHLWTGCVATAMGQVMKYYNYPKNGIGSHGYNSFYGWVEADFENTQYDWAGMNYNLVSENEGVAELLFHCAVSVNSQFFPNGTGAFDFSAWQALIQYFGYSPEAQFYWRDSYAGDPLELLRNELDEGRPVIYGGADSETSAGHTLVCDGYQDTAFFHFNWGWNGLYNGFFYLDSLIAGSNYFDFQHDAVVRIKPDIPEIIYIYPPMNTVLSAEEHSVQLSWDDPGLPSTLEMIGFNIYRDGIAVNPAVVTQNEYTDENVPAGDHEYFLKTVYIGAQSGPTETLEVHINGTDDRAVSYINVYPVPVTGYFCIPSGQIESNQIRIELMDITGKVIFDKTFRNNISENLKILLPEITSGLVFLLLDAGDLRYSQKIIVLKNK